MKKLFLIFTVIGLSLNKISAQAQQAHPTINNFVVSYKPIAQLATNTNTNSFPEIRVIPQATITLNPAASVSKIYFKILNSATNAIIYQVNYTINSAVVINNSGKKLFENTSGVIFISNGQDLALKPYKYEVTTEDAQVIMSPVFTAIK